MEIASIGNTGVSLADVGRRMAVLDCEIWVTGGTTEVPVGDRIANTVENGSSEVSLLGSTSVLDCEMWPSTVSNCGKTDWVDNKSALSESKETVPNDATGVLVPVGDRTTAVLDCEIWVKTVSNGRKGVFVPIDDARIAVSDWVKTVATMSTGFFVESVAFKSIAVRLHTLLLPRSAVHSQR